VAAITGGGSGIGRQTAIRFAREGASVAIIDIDPDAAEAARGELLDAGASHVAIRCDVSDVAMVRGCFASVVKELGTLDILFNNAGIVCGPGIEDTTDEEWHRQIATNLSGTFYCNREAMRIMIPKGYGKIINMSSIWGGLSDRGSNPGFSASKAGVVGLTRAVAVRAAKHNINVNAVAPGYVNTPIHSPAYKKKYPELAAGTPIGRIGEPDDIASTVLFLASDEASFIVGQTISPNGGIVV
jgi:NAD(P)-dependent dehydrogenase (short-subunit alcohol dehydrogenase family)